MPVPPTGSAAPRRASEVTTPFDHYLAGQEHYERNEPVAAIRHFDATLRQQPDHFWAQCLSAICWLRLEASGGRAGRLQRVPEARARIRLALHPPRLRLEPLAPRCAPPEVIRLRYRGGRRRLSPGDGAARAQAQRRAALRLARQPRSAPAPARRARQGGRVLARSDPARSGRLPSLTPRWRRSAGRQGKTDEALDLYARAIERQPDLAALYRDRAGVILASRELDPGAAVQALERPGSGDPAREAGQPRPGARPHESRQAAGRRGARRRGPRGLRGRDRAGPRRPRRPSPAARPAAQAEAAR